MKANQKINVRILLEYNPSLPFINKFLTLNENNYIVLNMKKILIASLVTFVCGSALAIDEQILNANVYLNKIQKNIDAQTQTSPPQEEKKYYQLKNDLKVGKNYNEIKMLQKQWGMEETGLYSAELEKFVKEAQIKKGLNATGVIDFNTWFILYEQPIAWRAEEVHKAIENWNKIKEKDLGKENKKMIVINVPSMMLYVYDKNETGGYTKALSMKVVIGSTKHQTPLTDLTVVSVKYNPTWTPTNNIVKRSAFDKEGNVKMNWLKSHSITIYNSNQEVIPYEELANHNYKELKFIQPAGDGNSLGLLKFETNSKDNIYLHDTNEKQYFGHNVRTYSSGCIRVEDYSKLASNLLGKNKEHISKQVSKNNTFWEKMQHVPVYFDTSRVSFDETGTPHFYNKAY